MKTLRISWNIIVKFMLIVAALHCLGGAFYLFSEKMIGLGLICLFLFLVTAYHLSTINIPFKKIFSHPMKHKLPRKLCTILFLIAIPCIFFCLGKYLIPFLARLYIDHEYNRLAAILFVLGLIISTALLWKSQLFTKRIKKLTSIILFVFVLFCGPHIWLIIDSHSDLDKDVYVPAAQGLSGSYYQDIVKGASHQPKSKKDLSLKQIYNMYSPAVVSIETKDKNGKPDGRGAGFIIHEAGVIITNFHVLQNNYSATVKLTDGKQYEAFVLAKNKEMDFLVLKINGTKFPCVVLGNSDTVEVGDEVSTIGNPEGLENIFADGIVGGVNQKKYDQVWLQVTIPIAPGNSGGPVFNSHGEVVGIMTCRAGENQIGLAIPINQVIKSIVNTKDTTK